MKRVDDDPLMDAKSIFWGCLVSILMWGTLAGVALVVARVVN